MRASECDCIVLAAGLSSRMPGSKMLREIDGEPLVRIAIRNALSVCRRVILVVGHDADAVVEAAGSHDEPRLTVVDNPHYREGMVGSIQAGMGEVTSAWFFVAPGDMPALSPAVYSAVAARASAADRLDRGDASGARGGNPPGSDGSTPLAVVPWYRDTRGHPVLVHSSLVPRLRSEPRGGRPMRELLARYPVARVHLDDPAITVDLDTEKSVEEYRRGRSRGSGRSG